MPDNSEIYGRIVRAIWVDWALEQPDVADHPSWTLPWDKLADRDREVDMRIGSAVATRAVHDAGLEAAAMRKQLLALSVQFPAIRRALVIAIAGADYEAEGRLPGRAEGPGRGDARTRRREGGGRCLTPTTGPAN